VSQRLKTTRIVVDALDEAADPTAIAEQRLRQFGEINSVKLVVGTRSNQLEALRASEVIDIDRPEYAEQKDIVDYVKERLLRAGEPGQGTPYSGKEQIAEQVAGMVAEKAYPNYLVARIVTEDLLLRPESVDPNSPEEIIFPRQVGAAFDSYLKRFDSMEVAVRDLLLPLAYTEGQGLPWDNIWAPLASDLAGRRYQDENIRWLLKEAGAFILESIEDGRSVYRLYHQALADTLRKGRTSRTVQSTFVKALVASVPGRPDQNAPDWLLASQYCRSHLATHAAKCEMLAGLVSDPLYLLAADPPRLLAAISSDEVNVPRDMIAV
jgi:hypothetical protein